VDRDPRGRDRRRGHGRQHLPVETPGLRGGVGLGGDGGVFFAAKMAFVSPESFTFFESVMICAWWSWRDGSIPGIILGAFLLVTLPEVFRDLPTTACSASASHWC